MTYAHSFAYSFIVFLKIGLQLQLPILPNFTIELVLHIMKFECQMII